MLRSTFVILYYLHSSSCVKRISVQLLFVLWEGVENTLPTSRSCVVKEVSYRRLSWVSTCERCRRISYNNFIFL